MQLFFLYDHNQQFDLYRETKIPPSRLVSFLKIFEEFCEAYIR